MTSPSGYGTCLGSKLSRVRVSPSRPFLQPCSSVVDRRSLKVKGQNAGIKACAVGSIPTRVAYLLALVDGSDI